MDYETLIEDVAVNLLELAVVRLPQDVKDAIGRAYQQETSNIGKTQLRAILDNIELAEEKGIPLCQDTGLVSFYLRAGSQFRGLAKVETALQKAVRRATVEIPLRPNTVDPFTEKNTDDNTGQHIPYVHWQIFEGDFLDITAFPKGAGSENKSALRMMTPSDGLNGLKEILVDTVVNAGGMPCPPTIIGVGIGGGANIAAELAKMALLRPMDEPNADVRAAQLEYELFDAVNKTGIGPMGLGGDSTTLAVKVDYAHRHPASYPVAIAIQCWAARKAVARLHSDGRVEYLTHRV